MKNAILILVLFFITLSASAQLAGTKWKGKVNIPKLTEVIFEFKNDVAVVTTATGMPVESCSYMVKSDTITFKKITGGSPCPVNSMFTVRYAIKNDQLSIIPLTDDCEGRKGTFSEEPLVRLNN